MLTAVIPTRNRPSDLAKAVASVLAQTRPPDEFIIVDQSPGDESRLIVESLWPGESRIKLMYIHDTSISGLVEAKQVAASRATGDIVCFLEDDIVLETDYIEQIELGFVRLPEMLGCCGLITNPPHQPPGYAAIFHIFHRGIFKDIRVGLYGHLDGYVSKLIASDKLSGGLSAWRREVFAAVPFDVVNGFHMFEDIDFSTRVARHFGPRLYVNPSARLEHHCSPTNREILGPRQRRKLTECIVYYKKRRNWPWATFSLSWLLLGMLIESLFQSYLSRSFGPVRGYFCGLRDGLAKRVIYSQM